MPVVYVFTEEPSARHVVEAVANRYAPNAVVKAVPHSGKRDLCSSFPRKMAAIRHPADARFIVLHDNDGAECHKLKMRLNGLVPSGVADRARIRLVMHELESWYLGQPHALAACGLIPDVGRMQKRKFRDPDLLTNAKQEFYRLHGRDYQQIAMAQLIGPLLDADQNRSASFRLFVRTLQEFAA